MTADSSLGDRGRIRHEVKLTAGFRKFFDTMMIAAKVDDKAKENMIGHKLPYLDDNYWRPKPDLMLQEYLKAVNALTINEENRLRIKVVDLQKQADRFARIDEKLKQVMEKWGWNDHN